MGSQVIVNGETNVPVLDRFDVIVVRGGFPGVCAAVAASRTGARTALVEKDGILGGQASAIYTFGMDGFIDRVGNHFAQGIPWEIITRAVDEEGIQRFLETPLIGTILDGMKVSGIIASGGHGPFALKANIVVDTTPHAQVAALAGYWIHSAKARNTVLDDPVQLSETINYMRK